MEQTREIKNVSAARDKKIPLVEVFLAVQGEGFNTGRKAVFIRLSGCNLACAFAEGVYCDTPYQKANLKLTMDELFLDMVPRLAELPPRDHYPRLADMPMVVLTGGEPTLSPFFDSLVERAGGLGYYVAVETNGTRWRPGLQRVNWITVSPKDMVPQGSPAKLHNPNPGSPALEPRVIELMRRAPGEFRYVITGKETPTPPYFRASCHFVSPAVRSDGSGEEWKSGFPGFAPGAVERCLEIVQEDPRWRISIQTHKVIGVR